MTTSQEYILSKVQEHIDSLRNILEDLLYKSRKPLKGEERARISEAYDLICKANDKILP